MQDALIFWSVAILFMVGAVAFILLPLMKQSKLNDYDAVNDHARRDMIVYKDQLRELEREQKRGMISGEEAESAALEIKRRM
ncbi:MAG: c-type cytochrome biogenesis protein CcmI, partial [Cohaesibacteraceae bacterium]|nr:c-type cytochrome biogenesis protein CcmI [Cohaesibacteraceae bacterium]